MDLNIIGLGGTGSFLAEPLIRYCISMDILGDVMFIDGDKYEESNIGRQSFASAYIGTNKAAYAAMKFSRSFPDHKFDFIDKFIGEPDLENLINSSPDEATFVCVDNNWFRKIIDNFVTSQLHHHLLIVSGNDEMTGQVQTVQMRGSGNITKHTVCSKHDDIKNSMPSEDRSAMSCEQLANLPGGGQIIVANMMSATLMLSHFIAFCENKTKRSFYETCFNCRTCEVSSYGVK